MVNTITGDDNANLLNGTDGDDEIFGLGANDNLNGGAGNDVLDGGPGTDVMAGGTGDDTYIVDDVTNPGVDTVNERANEGTDTVKTTTASYTLGVNVENLTFTGTGSFTGTGNTLDNVIVGGAGDDVLIGGAGADTLVGGGGNNTASYQTSSASVTASLVSPADSTGNAGDAAGDIYFDIANLTGGSGSDILIGDEFGNILGGGRGNDTLDGGAGDDTLDGGAGDDTYVFKAGFGNDTIIAFGDKGANQDVIQIDIFGVDSLDDVVMQQVGADVVITVSPTDTITLTNVLLGNLGADDFQFI